MSRRSRFDGVVPYSPPESSVRLAEKRCGAMIETYQIQQLYSAGLPGSTPRPTMMDVVVSAYLQGVADGVTAMGVLDIPERQTMPCECASCAFVAAMEGRQDGE